MQKVGKTALLKYNSIVAIQPLVTNKNKQSFYFIPLCIWQVFIISKLDLSLPCLKIQPDMRTCCNSLTCKNVNTQTIRYYDK